MKASEGSTPSPSALNIWYDGIYEECGRCLKLGRYWFYEPNDRVMAEWEHLKNITPHRWTFYCFECFEGDTWFPSNWEFIGVLPESGLLD